ncbi:MAG TPA: tetratricopeptide repeat protein, partial [Pyrinomonadaceae bacterium]|nr:tetratricopeptide repeat protein [Pyrinomonadaceae bacterium]
RPDPRPATVIHHKPHPATVVTKAPQSVESDKFIDLGDDFRRKQNWNAAEAAYKEAIKLSPGNADAVVELGFLYVDRDKMDEAQRTYAQLRSLSPSYANDLLAEINKRRNQRVH